MLIVLSVVTWLLLTPVYRIADRPDPAMWPILLESFLGRIFWAALDSLVIALLPLRLLSGSKIVGWSRAVWAGLYVVTLFAFIPVLLRPGTGYVSDTSRSSTVVVVSLFIAFALFSFGFWGYFRFRSPRRHDEAAVPV